MGLKERILYEKEGFVMEWIQKNQWRVTAVIQMAICLAAVVLSVNKSVKIMEKGRGKSKRK